MDADPFRLPDRSDLRELSGYVAAAALYIGIGLLWVPFLFNVVVAMAYLVAVVWLVPAAVRRARAR
jgi:hypothetical protein